MKPARRPDRQASPAVTRCTGYAREDLIGGDVNDFIHGDDVAAVVEGYEGLIAGDSAPASKQRGHLVEALRAGNRAAAWFGES